MIEDVLVKIDSLVIPYDFYILDMEHDSYDSSNNTLILFKRPFLKNANTKIDCGKDTDTTKELISSPKCRNVKVINNLARPRSNHEEVNYINYK